MTKQKEKLNIMIDDISDEGVDFHSIEAVDDIDDDENISIEELTSGKYTFDRKPKVKAFLKR